MTSTPQGLDAWLLYIDSVHPSDIELGLGRVAEVARRLSIDQPPLTIVTVGGTNGKGSTVRMLEAIWQAGGHRVGAATSPHVSRFNERIRIAGHEASDAAIVSALAAVEAGRGDIALTYFEFATLASMQAFVTAGCDVAVMEVGLGGRLDAVNLWDTDCAILTSIALDHADWLGTDRAVIATEKAAIGRRGRPIIIGDPAPPATLAPFVEAAGMQSIDIGSEPMANLPTSSLPGDHQRRNAGCALAAVSALAERLPMDMEVAKQALHKVALTARFEERDVRGQTLILDVAHNPAAAAALADAWRERFADVRGIAVFAALADKDIEGIAAELSGSVAHWICVGVDAARASAIDTLAVRVRGGLPDSQVDSQVGSQVGSQASPQSELPIETAPSVDAGLERALALAEAHGLPVLVCGSFVTITAAHETLGDA